MLLFIKSNTFNNSVCRHTQTPSSVKRESLIEVFEAAGNYGMEKPESKKITTSHTA